MGYFSAYFGGSKPTKRLLAGRVAALIKCARNDERVSGVVFSEGSIVLKDDFTVSFCGQSGRAEDGDGKTQVVARVVLKSQLKKFMSDSEIKGGNWPTNVYEGAALDWLTYAVVTEFEKQLPQIQNLESMFKPIGGYVFVGKSAQYWDAEKRNDKKELERLLGAGVGSHYLMETYENMGSAKLREREMASKFVGGVVDAYEVLL